MSSLWTDLLLLHGHIHDPELVRRLANTPSTSPSRRSGGKRRKQKSVSALTSRLPSTLVDATRRRAGSAGEDVLADAEWRKEFLNQHFAGMDVGQGFHVVPDSIVVRRSQ